MTKLKIIQQEGNGVQQHASEPSKPNKTLCGIDWLERNKKNTKYYPLEKIDIQNALSLVSCLKCRDKIKKMNSKTV